MFTFHSPKTNSRGAWSIRMVLVLVPCFFAWLWPCKTSRGALPTKPSGRTQLTAEDYYQWHRFKDKGGPTFSGSPAWHRYMHFLEEQFKKFGVIDMVKNSWTYQRWYTSDWPGHGDWSLISNGNSVRVAAYGPYSGSTGPEGISAQLVYYDPVSPPEDIEGKIVVYRTAPHPDPPFPKSYREMLTFTDYEYLTDPETFPPLFTTVPASQAVYFDTPWQFWNLHEMMNVLAKGKAAGGVVVFDMSYDRLAGLYPLDVFPVYNVPTLFVDRIAGKKVIRDAKNGCTANLKLVAHVESAETYQLIGYLPGKNYGTERDERILLRTHTDGPSISQENGALGLLAVVANIAQIPQKNRQRTLMIFLDNRHFMPGTESAFRQKSWFTKHPEAKKSIVGLIAMEHLGEIEYKEKGEAFLPTGRAEVTYLYTRNDPVLIEKAVQVVKETNWPRVIVKCPEKKGIHGKSQGVWIGMGDIALEYDLPAYAAFGGMGAYWETNSGLDRFDKELFATQVKAMTQLTIELMNRKRR